MKVPHFAAQISASVSGFVARNLEGLAHHGFELAVGQQAPHHAHRLDVLAEVFHRLPLLLVEDDERAGQRLLGCRAGFFQHVGQDLQDRKSTRLHSSHYCSSRMPSSACKKKQTSNTSSTESEYV